MPDRALNVAQGRRAQRDLLDRAGRRADVDHVTDAVLVLDQHEEAGEEVLHDRLRTEAEGDAADAGTGDERGQIDLQLPEHQERSDAPHHGRDDAAQHECDGLGAGLGPLVGRLLDEELAGAALPQLVEGGVGGRVGDRLREPHDRPLQHAGDDPRRDQDQQDANRPVERPLGRERQKLAVGPAEDLFACVGGIRPARVGHGIDRVLPQLLHPNPSHGGDGTRHVRTPGGFPR